MSKLPVQDFLSYARFPKKLVEDFTKDYPNEGIEKLRKIKTLRDRWIVFYGPPGTGKTYAAAASAYAYYYKGYTKASETIFVPAYEFNTADESFVDHLSTRYSLVIIDDFAAEDHSATYLIENLILRLYDSGKYLVMTTNLGENVLTLDSLENLYRKNYDGRVVSRLFNKTYFIRCTRLARKREAELL